MKRINFSKVKKIIPAVLVAGIFILLMTSIVQAISLPDIKKFQKIEVSVMPGDTAWNIEKKLAPDYDTRKLLDMVEQLNGCSAGNLQVGQTVVFLKQK